MIGATASRLAMITPISEMQIVNNRALCGSPPFEDAANTLRNGIIPSWAIACNKRGALKQELQTFQRGRFSW